MVTIKKPLSVREDAERPDGLARTEVYGFAIVDADDYPVAAIDYFIEGADDLMRVFCAGEDLRAALRAVVATRGPPQPDQYPTTDAYRAALQAYDWALVALIKAGKPIDKGEPEDATAPRIDADAVRFAFKLGAQMMRKAAAMEAVNYVSGIFDGEPCAATVEARIMGLNPDAPEGLI